MQVRDWCTLRQVATSIFCIPFTRTSERDFPYLTCGKNLFAQCCIMETLLFSGDLNKKQKNIVNNWLWFYSTLLKTTCGLVASSSISDSALDPLLEKYVLKNFLNTTYVSYLARMVRTLVFRVDFLKLSVFWYTFLMLSLVADRIRRQSISFSWAIWRAIKITWPGWEKCALVDISLNFSLLHRDMGK